MPYEASRVLESISGDRAIKENAHGPQVNVYDKLKALLRCSSRLRTFEGPPGEMRALIQCTFISEGIPFY
jgi:hypothetical protein